MSQGPSDRDLRFWYRIFYDLDQDSFDAPIFQKHEKITREVVARFVRGNVARQNAAIIDSKFLDLIREKVDKKDFDKPSISERVKKLRLRKE